MNVTGATTSGSRTKEFVHEHPFLATLLGITAINGVVTIVRGDPFSGSGGVDVKKFVEDHPFLTFFIMTSAISGVVAIVRGRSSEDDGSWGVPPFIRITSSPSRSVPACPPGEVPVFLQRPHMPMPMPSTMPMHQPIRMEDAPWVWWDAR